MTPLQESANTSVADTNDRDSTIGLIALVIILVVTVLFALPQVSGSGFEPTNKVTETTQEVGGVITKTTAIEYLPGKTFWDLLQLLIVPAVLIWGAYWLNQRAQKRDSETTEARRKNEDRIAEERLQETTLQTYLDQMSDLLLNRGLREANPESPVRLLARVRTLTTLRRLNGKRNGIIVNFLIQSDLFGANDSFNLLQDVDLSGADFHGARMAGFPLNNKELNDANFIAANLAGATFWSTNLKRAKLSACQMQKTSLHDADLTDADLSNVEALGANLEHARLVGANLSSAYFQESRLSSANLSKADLNTASFSKANLFEADLTDANLKLADFSGANLSHAIVTDEQLKCTWALYGARMPQGDLYDGRFCLPGDEDRAGQEGVNTSDKDMMGQWYLAAR